MTRLLLIVAKSGMTYQTAVIYRLWCAIAQKYWWQNKYWRQLVLSQTVQAWWVSGNGSSFPYVSSLWTNISVIHRHCY